LDHITIRLINAEQYIKRKDVQNISWFALPIALLDHPDFFGITGNEFKAFFYIISLYGKLKKYEYQINTDHCCHNLQISKDDLNNVLKKLHGKAWQVVDFIDHVTPTSQICTETSRPRTATYKQTNIQTNIISSSELEKPASSKKQTFKISGPQDFHEIFSENIFQNFNQLYPDADFQKREFTKMHTWLISNPKKNLKTERGWTQFVANWFDRAWNQNQSSAQKRPATLFGMDPSL
jgi:hypothetical protein